MRLYWVRAFINHEETRWSAGECCCIETPPLDRPTYFQKTGSQQYYWEIMSTSEEQALEQAKQSATL
jgi:hypothetical protein